MGDLAKMQAGTRVNAEQASKRAMWEPTRLRYGEGRSFPGEMSDSAREVPPGYWRRHVCKGSASNTGSPAGWWCVPPTGDPRGTGQAVRGGGEARSTEEAG
jgi:hypothetical protein